MNYLKQLYLSITSVFSGPPDEACYPSLACDVSSRKRRRDSDDDDPIEIDNSPQKRFLLGESAAVLRESNMNTQNINMVPITTSTQTYGHLLLPSKPKRLGCDNFHKTVDNWTTVIDDDDTTSPSKFKNTYKAPKHVRSPKKRLKPTLSTRNPLNNGSVMDSIDLTSPKTTRAKTTMISSRGIFGTPGLSPKSQIHNKSTATGCGMSRTEFQRLLCSVLADSSKEAMKKVSPPRITETVDLTEEDAIDLTTDNTPPQPKSSGGLGRKGLPTNAVRPNFINLADDDEPTRYRQETSTVKPVVRRLNSFEDNLRDNKYTNPSLIALHAESYEKFLQRIRKEEDSYDAKIKCDRQISNAAIDELITSRLTEHLRITDSILIEEEEVEIETVMPELTKDMMAKISHAWNERLNLREVLVSKFKLDVTRTDLVTLKNLNWLNDAVINFYMELIVERGGTAPAYPSVYAFSTFFYPTLTKGYERVRRYTRKVDLFSKDIILVPIHLAVHWCMARIDLRKKKIYYYDSMKASNQKALDTLLDYLVQEHKDKKKEELDTSEWELVNDKDIPCQRNGSDCGVFACTFGEYSTRNSRFNFSQDNMPYMRQKMVVEILTGALLL